MGGWLDGWSETAFEREKEGEVSAYAHAESCCFFATVAEGLR